MLKGFERGRLDAVVRRAALHGRDAAERGQRPPLFIGYFEGLSSERGIAWRVADSLSLRAFLDSGRDRDMFPHVSGPRGPRRSCRRRTQWRTEARAWSARAWPAAARVNEHHSRGGPTGPDWGQTVSPPRDRGLPGVGPRNTELDRYTSEGIFRECVGPFTRSTPRGGGRHSKSFWMDCPMTPSRKPRPWWRCWRSTATSFGCRSPSLSAMDSSRPEGLTTGVRLFFVFAPGHRIVVLDGYVKKRTSIPARIMARIRRLQANTEKALRNRGRQEQLASRIMQRSPTNADSPEEPVARATTISGPVLPGLQGRRSPEQAARIATKRHLLEFVPDARDEAG